MSYIYNKPLSLEQIFSLFDKNGNGEISTQEVLKNKNSIFDGFTFTKNITLEEFEQTNLRVYTEYEITMTKAWTENAKNSANPEERKLAEQALNDAKQRQIEELDKMVDEDIKKMVPDFASGKNSPPKNEFVEPDPGLCRDTNTHDW